MPISSRAANQDYGLTALESEAAVSKSQIIAYGKAVSSSLDILVAFDLSTHLLRAFSLKHDRSCNKRLRKSFTAWPLPPREVPRQLKGEVWTSRIRTSSPYILKTLRPSRELQDLLVAGILRLSKTSLEQRLLQLTPCSLSQSPTAGGKVVQDHGENMNLGSENESEASQESMDPAFLADDDEAAQILRLSTQHFVAKLDALLTSLYHLRKSAWRSGASQGKTAQGQRVSNRRDNSSRSNLTERDDKYLGRKKPPKTPVRNRACETDSFSTRAQGGVYTQGPRQTTRRLIRHLAFLTWNDVFVTASMCSFDPGTLSRAYARCSPLLRPPQAVQFYRDKHRSPDASQTKFLAKDHWSYEAFAEIDKVEVGEKMHTDGFMQPIEGRKSWRYWKGAARE